MLELTTETEETLKEYTKLQQEEQKLKVRKQALQEKLKTHLRSDEKTTWYPDVGGVRLKVSYRSVSQIEYNEEILCMRLGDRYPALLEPDLRKLRAELPNLGKEPEPLLSRIGSPSPEKVKEAVEKGIICANEFKGAFSKTVKEYISIATLKENET